MIASFFFLIFILGILTKSGLSSAYAFMGLQLWFEKMIPALLPFMILSGIMIRTGTADRFAKLFSPWLGRVLKASRSACYVIFVGFLCGFPMGARTIAQLRERKQLTKEESRWLLAFCNNIGPVYFCSFVIPLLGITHPLPFLTGAFGLPFFYGCILRWTAFRGMEGNQAEDHAPKRQNLLEAMAESIQNSLQSILMLGGYMILFCLFNLLPHAITGKPQPFLSVLFEITSGLRAMQGHHAVYCLVMLCFGGLSCMAQTYDCLKNTDLKECMPEYVLHKIFLCILTFGYYVLLFRLSPDCFSATP